MQLCCLELELYRFIIDVDIIGTHPLLRISGFMLILHKFCFCSMY